MGIWGILMYLAIGALAGWLAGLLMKSKGGLLFNIIMGIIGSFVGCWVGGLIGLNTTPLSSSFSVWAVVVAVGGACLVIALYRLIFKRK